MKDKNTIVSETVTAILQQGGLDERYRFDFSRLVVAAYEAGAATSTTKFVSAPLSDGEIAALRSLLSK